MPYSLELTSHGDYSKTLKYLRRIEKLNIDSLLQSAGKRGVEELRKNTPKDTGTTANSWSYEITKTDKKIVLTWKNSNIHRGINIAVIIQTGHATRNGGYVKGVDYINPSLEPVFQDIADSIRKAVTS